MSLVGALLGSVLKGGALAGAVRLLEGGRSPALRHLLWAAAVAAHLLLLAVSPVAPSWSVPGLPLGAAPDRSSVPAVLGNRAAGGIRPPRAEPRPAPSAPGAARVPATGPPGSAGAEVEAGTWDARRLGRVLLSLWAAGALVLLLRLVGRFVAVARAVERAAPCADPGWARAVEEARRELSVLRSVEVRIAADAKVPQVAGLPRPVLLLPAGARRWSGERRRAVAFHEVAHLARRDQLWRLLARAVRAVFWFAPTAWYAVARMEGEAEAACDGAAVSAGLTPERYLRELVAVIRESRGRAAGLASPLGRRSTLLRRARRLLASGGAAPPLPGRRALIAAGAIAVGGVVLLAGLQLTSGTAVSSRPAPAAVVSGPASGAGLAPATGCPYQGGLHRDRVREGSAGELAWEVAWNGPGCRVRFRAGPAGPMDLSWGLVPREGWVRVEVRGPSLERSVRLARRGPDRPLRVTLDGRRAEGTARREALAWYGGLAREVGRHTGYDAWRRVPELLSSGGIRAVLAGAERTAGGHAAGVYLRELLALEALRPAQVERVLTLAAVRVTNDGVMARLLADVAARHDVSAPGLRDRYLEAAGTLAAKRARATARSRLEGEPPAGR